MFATMWKIDKIMMTRSFLFLLAVITGFSAPQATNATQQSQTSIGAAAVIVPAMEYAANCDALAARPAYAVHQKQSFADIVMADIMVVAEQDISRPCTHRGDRTRE